VGDVETKKIAQKGKKSMPIHPLCMKAPSFGIPGGAKNKVAKYPLKKKKGEKLREKQGSRGRIRVPTWDACWFVKSRAEKKEG